MEGNPLSSNTISVAASKALLVDLELGDEAIVIGDSDKDLDVELEEVIFSLVSDIDEIETFCITVDRVDGNNLSINYEGIKMPSKKDNLVDIFNDYFSKIGLKKLVITYDGIVNVNEIYYVPDNVPVFLLDEEVIDTSMLLNVTISYIGDGYTFSPDNILTEDQEKELVELMIEKDYNCLVVKTDGDEFYDSSSEQLDLDYDQSDEYVSALNEIENILESEYAGKEFILSCNGFKTKSWQLKTFDVDTQLSNNLELSLIQLMSVSNIDYIDIKWNGSEFENFFPFDVFTKIVSLQKDFDAAATVQNGFKMIEISSEITQICEALTDELDNESYLNLAIEYEDIIELVQSLEIQELMLMEYFTTEGVKDDEIVMLYKDFSRNLDRLESIYPGSLFVANMARFDNDFNNLELATFSEENAEYKLGMLDAYISLNHEASVFTLVLGGDDYSFASSVEGEQASSDLVKYTLDLMDVLCIEDFTVHCNCGELEIDSEEEIPYFENMCDFSTESYDENGILQITDEDIIARFSTLHYDLENDILACLVDDDDLGKIDKVNWKRVCEPKKRSQFREKWFFDEVGDSEDDKSEILEEEFGNDTFFGCFTTILCSLDSMNLGVEESDKFITKELSDLNFQRLID